MPPNLANTSGSERTSPEPTAKTEKITGLGDPLSPAAQNQAPNIDLRTESLPPREPGPQPEPQLPDSGDQLQTEFRDSFLLGIVKWRLRACAGTVPLKERLDWLKRMKTMLSETDASSADPPNENRPWWQKAAADLAVTLKNLKATSVITAGILAAELFTTAAASLFSKLTALGDSFITVGNAGSDTLVARLSELNPANGAAMLLTASTLEELVFRGVPLGVLYFHSMLGTKKVNAAPLVGIGSALLFALVHNLADPGTGSGIMIARDTMLRTDYIPLPQFIFGLGAWQIATRYGLPYTVFAHCLLNTACTLAFTLLS